MRTRLVSAVLAAIVIAGAVVYKPPVEIQREPAPIDFVHLNNQAMSALQTLRVSQEQRIALQQVDEASF